MKWTAQETKILEKYYAIEGPNVYLRLPGRSPRACQGKAARLGLETDVRKVSEQRTQSKNGKNYWTPEEDDILRAHYPKEGKRAAARFERHPLGSVITRARLLGLNVESRCWTQEEVAVLREFFPVEGHRVAARLPGHTPFSCYSQAKRMGLVRDPVATSRWTKADDEILRKYYVEEKKKVAERLPHHTLAAIHKRASRLGIRCRTRREGALR